MKTIAKITRNRGAGVLTFSDGGQVRIPYVFVEKLQLSAGSEADTGLILKRVENESLPYALAEVIRAQARRDHSRMELYRLLADKGYPAAVAEAAVSQLNEAGIVDEARFGEALVYRKRWQKGKNALRIEMRAKGLEQETIEKSLEGLDEEEEYGADLLRDQKMRGRGMSNDKIQTALLRRGYGRTMIIRVLKDIQDGGQ